MAYAVPMNSCIRMNKPLPVPNKFWSILLIQFACMVVCLDQCVHSIEDLETLSTTIMKLNDTIGPKIVLYTGENANLENELEQCDLYSDKVTNLIRTLRARKDTLDVTTGTPISTVVDQVATRSDSTIGTRINLPQLPLPVYSHAKGELIEEFFDSFETIIDKYTLADYEKFGFLERQLSKEPLVLIKSLQGAHKGYDEAKQLLLKAFSNPTLRKFEAIKRLSTLKLKSQSETYSFIGEIRSILATFRNPSIKLDVNSILQYFIWSAFPEELKVQFIHIVNNSHPSLQDIEEHIFEAADRFISACRVRELNDKIRDQEVLGLAVNIDQSKTELKSVKCILCNGDHHLSKCDSYKTAKDKTDKLRSMNRCVRCAGANHNANNCKFSFYKQCFLCKAKNHFTYLCLTKSKDSRHSNSMPRDDVQLNANCGSLNSDYSSGKMLPTFSVETNSGRRVRCLKDSGCTHCFIRGSIVKELGWTILKKIKVSVNGMNTDQVYDSDLVEGKLKLGNRTYTVKAITLPDIKITLNLPDLTRIVQEFRNKGYEFADSFLNDNV